MAAKAKEVGVVSGTSMNFGVDSSTADLTKAEIDRMFRDAQVRTAWKIKMLSEIAAGWSITYPGTDTELGDTLTRHVEWQFENVDIGPGMHRGLYDVIDTLGRAQKYGHTVYEPVWEYDSHAKQIVLRRWKPLPPEYDTFVWNDRGQITRYYQSFSPGGDIPYKDVIHITNGGYEENWLNPYGTSELRGAWRYFLMKDQAEKWWMDFMERKSVGPLVITIPPNTSEDDRTQIQTIVKSLNQRLAFTLPGGDGVTPGAEVTQIQMGDATKVFTSLIEYCDTLIMQATLTPDLIMSGSSGGSGSRAVADVHADVLKAAARSGQLMKEPVINFLIKQMCLYNFADRLELDADNNPIVPVFRFNVPPQRTMEGVANAIAQLIQTGVLSPGEEWIRDQLGIPHIESETSADTGTDEEPAAEATHTHAEAAQKPTQPTLHYKENYGHLKRMYSDATNKLRGRMNDWLTRVINRMVKKADKTLKRADKGDELTSTAAQAPGSDFRYSAVLNLDVTPKEKDELASIFTNVGTTTAKLGADDITGPLNIPKTKPERALKWLKAQNTLNSRSISADVEKSVQQVLLSGLSNGKTIAEMRSDIEGIQADIMDRQAETIARTNVSKAYNMGRDDAMKSSDLVIGYVIDAVLDSRTSDICENLAGQFISKDDPDYDTYMPPLHFNCRSVASPVTKLDDETTLTPVDKTIKPQEGFGG